MKKLLLLVLFFVSFPATGYAARKSRDDVKPSAFQDAALLVSANVHYGAEDEESVPVSADFYLLNKNMVDILKTKNFEPFDENGDLLRGDDGYLEALARTVADRDEESRLLAVLIQDAIRRNQLAAISTDRSGLGRAKTLKTGNYYLFGYAQIDDEIFVWNLLVRLAAGQNRAKIDQHNAGVVITANNCTLYS